MTRTGAAGARAARTGTARTGTARTIPVELADRRYDVVVGNGARHELAARLPGVLGGRPSMAAVVTQAGLVDQPWFGEIDTGVAGPRLCVPEGEDGKCLASVEALCRGFAAARLSRHDVVVAVGGGLVTDLAGFAASVYARGIALVNVPTTLLGQVDAAIGGKTGANLPEGKNLVGAFWQPALVLCDTDTLGTLSPRELACGRGEMAKYALLDGGAGDAGAPGGAGDAGAPGVAEILELPLEEQVARCVAIKAAVVAADEREGAGASGLAGDRPGAPIAAPAPVPAPTIGGRPLLAGRAALNYGHTLAHALEAAAFAGRAGWDLRHGEAVAVGLVFAAELARRLGRIGDDEVARHRQVVAGFGLATALPPGASAAELLAVMARDKKADHDLTFVLDGPNGVEVVRRVDPALVVATLTAMGGRA